MMTKRSHVRNASLMLLTIALWVSFPQPTTAQHNDLQISYVNQKIEVQQQDPRGLVFPSDFPISGIERQFTTLPGFASETDVGLGIGSGDQIVYNVLENLLFWDGIDFVMPPTGTQIRVKNNPPNTPYTVVTQTSGEQLGSFSPPLNRIGAAGSSGNFHVDLQWFLEPNNAPFSPPPDFGAYGVKFTLSTDAPGIENSDPILMVFNFGLDAASYDAAMSNFAELLTATTFTWNSHVTGNWGDATNWTPADGPPVAGDTALIESNGAVVSVPDDQAASTTSIREGMLWLESAATLTSSVSLSGGTTGGTGTIIGAVTNSGGMVAPGASTGTLTVDGDFTQSAGSYQVEVEGADLSHDSLEVIGHATLGGNLIVKGLSPLATLKNHTLTILTSTSGVSGAFSTTPSLRDGAGGGHLGHGIFFDGVSVGSHDVTVDVFQAREGDTDADQDVDITDFNRLAQHFDPGGQNFVTNDWVTADFDTDADVDITDFNSLAQNFSPGGYRTQFVPEPSALRIMLFVLLVVWCTRIRSVLTPRMRYSGVAT